MSLMEVLIGLWAIFLMFAGCDYQGDDVYKPNLNKSNPIKFCQNINEKQLMQEALDLWQEKITPNLYMSEGVIETGIPGNSARVMFDSRGNIRVGVGGNVIYIWVYDLQQKTFYFPGSDATSISLFDGYLPIPILKWPVGNDMDVELELTPLIKNVSPPQSSVETVYLLKTRIYNSSKRCKKLKLMLAVIPNVKSKVHRFDWHIESSKNVLNSEGLTFLKLPQSPDYFISSKELYDLIKIDQNNKIKAKPGIKKYDHNYWPAAVCVYNINVKPAIGDFASAKAKEEIEIHIPAIPGSNIPDRLEIQRRYRKTHLYWTGQTEKNQFSYEIPHRTYQDAIRACTAFLLLQCKGDRAFPQNLNITEAALTSLALTRTGNLKAAKYFLCFRQKY